MKIFLLLLVFLFFAAGCEEEVTPPDKVVNEYWRLIEDNQREEAGLLIVDGREDEIGDFDWVVEDGIGEEIEGFSEKIQERYDMKADGYEEDNGVAMVNVTVNKPDLKHALEMFFEEAFEEMFAMAFAGASQEEMDQKAEELIMEAFEKADDITHEEEAELHLVNGEWKIYDWHFRNIEERMDQIDNMLREMDEIGVEIEEEPPELVFEAVQSDITVDGDLYESVTHHLPFEGNYEVDLLEVQELGSILEAPSEWDDDAEAQGRFVGIRYELRNNTDDELFIDTAFNHCVAVTDGQRKWHADGEACMIIAEKAGDQRAFKNVGAGFSAISWVVFDVPDDAEIVGLIFGPGSEKIPISLP